MVFIPSGSAYAATSVHVNYNEPDYDEYTGYITLIYYSSGAYMSRTFLWTITPIMNGMPSSSGSDFTLAEGTCMDITIYGSTIQLTSWNLADRAVGTSNYQYVLSLYMLDDSGTFMQITSGKKTGSYTYSYSETSSYYGFQFKGNVGYTSLPYSSPFTIIWADRANDYQYYIQIVNAIQSMNISLGGKLDGITNYLSSLNENVIDIEDVSRNILSQLNTYLPDIVNELEDVNSELDRIFGALHTIYERLGYILDETKEINAELDRIREILEMQGEESTEKLEDSSLGELSDGEESLMEDTSDDEQELTYTYNDTFWGGNRMIWTWIDRFIKSHPMIIILYLTLLTVGIVTLILGR